MNLTKISIERPSLIIVLFSLLTLVGYIGYKNLSYELMPDFAQPVVVIKTIYPGAEPEEVETSVSKNIEDALSNLEGVDYLITKSLPNASVIIAYLNYGTDLDKAMQEAQRYIDNIKKDLPNDVMPPIMSEVSPNDLPIMTINATSNLSSAEFYQKMIDDYLPQIKQIKGVAEMTILGGEQREIQVKLDQEKLQLNKISINQIVQAMIMSGKDIPAGAILSDTERNSVRVIGKFKSIADIENVQIGMNEPGSPIYIKDVATVIDGVKEITSVSRFNGKNGVGFLLKKQGDANAVDVSTQVKARLKYIEENNKKADVKFIVADDTTDNTIAAVNAVVHDLILAVILVSIIMLLFLRSFRNSFIVLIAIPTSLVTAFGAMWIMGYTLNLITLLAMSLIIGILVDDATVVLENIQRHLDMGKDKRTAAMDGRMEIGFSALSITLVDVVVFIPILFLQVFIKDMLAPFAVIVIVSTLTSLLVGFTLTPWLASRIGKSEDLQPTNFFNKFLLWFERQLDAFINWYGSQIKWLLDHKKVMGLIMLLLIIMTGATLKQGIIGKELIATGDQGKFRLSLEYDKYTSVKENNIQTQKIEAFLLHQPDIVSVFTNIAGPTSGIGSLGMSSANKSEFTIQLKDKKELDNMPTETYMKQLRKVLQDKYPSVKYSMAAIGLIPRTSPIEITFSGNTISQVMAIGKQFQDYISQLPGADNVNLSVEEGNPEYKIIPNQDKMQRLGLNTAYLGVAIRTAITGNDDATMTENGTEYPIRVWLDNSSRKNYQSLRDLTIVNPKGTPIKLSQVADIVKGHSASLLERKDRQPAVTLTADALGVPSGTLADMVVSYVKENPLPEGMQMTWGSDVKKQNEGFGALGKALLIALVLIYLIMVALYDSFIYPFVVLFSIPVAVIGALLALNLTISNLSIFAFLGLIMLMGLVVKNAILIVDFTNQLKAQGMHYKEALVKAGKERMRPILMTTISMVVGMLPIALAKGSGSEWKNALAWIIIGGLTSSLILTVYLVPVVYAVVDGIKAKFKIK